MLEPAKKLEVNWCDVKCSLRERFGNALRLDFIGAHFVCAYFFISSAAASWTPILALWKFSPPWSHTA